MAGSVPARVAVVGAGIAGITCARRLVEAGLDVRLFEKSRGVGGRLATRRAQWTDGDGVVHPVAFDHGAPGFSVRSQAFGRFVEEAVAAGWLAPWAPRMAAGSFRPLDGFASWIPTPDMPELCRRLGDGIPVALGQAIDAVRRDDRGWRVEWLGAAVDEGFANVVFAIPPLQVVKLLEPHRIDWAQQALRLRMLPCWTLMGVAEHRTSPPEWDAAWPLSGPLAWLVRNDTKPGRAPAAGRMHWVAHANAAWSQTHLETPAAEVQQALQTAVEDLLGRPPLWRHAAVHRWRYASVARAAERAAPRFWWDPALGLGVCGDFLGGAGVEGAWLSGSDLAGAMTSHAERSPDPLPCDEPPEPMSRNRRRHDSNASHLDRRHP